MDKKRTHNTKQSVKQTISPVTGLFERGKTNEIPTTTYTRNQHTQLELFEWFVLAYFAIPGEAAIILAPY